MSAPIPGNPFLLEAFRGTGADLAIASSSYAVAYEMRTANLIAFYSQIDHPHDQASQELHEMIVQRLGLREAGDE